MFVYILRSLKDGNHYIGISHDPDQRLKSHNDGKNFSTRYRRPWVLIHQEEYSNIASARERERYLKSYKGSKEKADILNSVGV